MAIENPYKMDANKKAEYLEQLRDGLNRGESARAIGVSRMTVWEHRKDDPDFDQACKDAQDEAVEEVEDALYESAVNGNVTAAIFYLKNRAPGRWKDVQQREYGGKDGGPVRVEVSIAERLERARQLLDVGAAPGGAGPDESADTARADIETGEVPNP
jgi:hypothetical protein